MAKRVNVTINPKDGSVSYDLEGFVGTECTDLTNVLTKGNKITEQELKAEYNAPAGLPIYTSD